jgi:hypothetical protein
MPSPKPLPVADMSAAQLARYRQTLVRYLRRSEQQPPQHRKMRACLAEVMAEEQARRLADRVGAVLLVPRIRM